MAGPNLFDAVVGFGADASAYDNALRKAKSDADSTGTAIGRDLGTHAQSSGSEFGQKFGKAVKTAAGAALGAGIGMATGAMLSGANELNQIQANYQAQTGATASEAAAMSQSVVALYGNTTKSMTEVGDALTAIKTDFNLSGQAAEDAAGHYLKFAEVTGQTTPAAIDAMSKAMKAWNLDAAGGQTVMDMLVVSHQKFGLNVADSTATLTKMAPAFQAAGLSVNDAIGYLDAFQKAGVDSATVSTAFGKALTKVKSPEELKTLIAQIQATPNDFDRAALATSLFGAKAGPRMAEALKPGSASLDDIIAQLGDTTGASDKAGEAAESSFGAQFTKLMHQAGGQLASFGQNFGPLVLGFSSLLPMLTPVLTTIGGGIGGLLGLNSAAGLVESTPEIGAAAGEVGTASGGVFDTLFAGAVALLPVLLIAALIAVIAILILNPDIRNKVIDFAKSVIKGILDGLKTLGNVLAGAVGTAFKVVGQVIGSAMAAIGKAIGAAVQLWIAIYIGIPLKIAGLIGQIPGVFLKAIQAVGQIVGDGIASVVGTILSIPGKIGGLIASIPGALGGLAAAFGKIAEDMVNNFMGFILGIPDKVGSILHNIPGLSQAMDLAGGLGNLIPSFDVGTVSLNRTGLIVAHAGEAIIPANLNRQIQSGQAMYGAMGTMTATTPQAKPNISIEVNNPKPEPAGQSVQTNIRRLQALGVY